MGGRVMSIDCSGGRSGFSCYYSFCIQGGNMGFLFSTVYGYNCVTFRGILVSRASVELLYSTTRSTLRVLGGCGPGGGKLAISSTASAVIRVVFSSRDDVSIDVARRALSSLRGTFFILTRGCDGSIWSLGVVRGRPCRGGSRNGGGHKIIFYYGEG